MKRKKWTPKTEITDGIVKFREKRKWQIALRRYIFRQGKSSEYAPFFGLDVEKLRKWLEIQFLDGMDWDNFSTVWQLDHIIPVIYFDFSKEKDLRLCWNFTNIRVESTHLNRNKGAGVGVIGAKGYFELLFKKTNYQVCADMVKKIEELEIVQLPQAAGQEQFILENKELLETLSSFSTYEFTRLNDGMEIKSILEERELINRILK